MGKALCHFSLSFNALLWSLTTMVLVTGSKDYQNQEEGSFSQEGQVHKQDVPLGYSGHHYSQEPALFSIFWGVSS
jgi:hypothetical protein